MQLHKLKLETAAALTRTSTETTPLFQRLGEVFREYQIPSSYANDLLQGFEMDVENSVYDSQEDLELYAYRIAGVVEPCLHSYWPHNYGIFLVALVYARLPWSP